MDQEIDHIRIVFKRLCYPKFFIDRAITKAKSRFFNPPIDRQREFSKALVIPFHRNLSNARKILRDPKDNIKLVFKYNNSLASKLVHNKSKKPDDDVGVYAIPCKDCNKHYFGESGRGLAIRKIEHKRACRMGNRDSMVAKHTWDLDHRIDWEGAKVVYKCNDIGKRRVVEGALINLSDTFEGNKAFTSEDPFTNKLVCKSLNIKLDSFSTAPNARPPSASPVPILGRVAQTLNAGIGEGDVVTDHLSNIGCNIRRYTHNGGTIDSIADNDLNSSNNNNCNINNNNNNNNSNSVQEMPLLRRSERLRLRNEAIT